MIYYLKRITVPSDLLISFVVILCEDFFFHLLSLEKISPAEDHSWNGGVVFSGAQWLQQAYSVGEGDSDLRTLEKKQPHYRKIPVLNFSNSSRGNSQ